MNRRKHLYTILQEECAEVVQAVSKIKRFGITNIQPKTGKCNFDILIEELNDVLAMVEMLEEDGLPLSGEVPDRERIVKKKAQVEKYLEYSRGTGDLVN